MHYILMFHKYYFSEIPCYDLHSIQNLLFSQCYFHLTKCSLALNLNEYNSYCGDIKLLNKFLEKFESFLFENSSYWLPDRKDLCSDNIPLRCSNISLSKMMNEITQYFNDEEKNECLFLSECIRFLLYLIFPFLS